MMQQYSVFVKNKVGAILKLTKALKAGGFSIRAFSVYDTPDFNILRLVFDQGVEPAQFLREEGFFFKVSPVVGVVLEDKPGYLSGVLEAVSDANISINYMYSLLLPNSDNQVVMLMHSSDDQAMEQLLREKSYTLK